MIIEALMTVALTTFANDPIINKPLKHDPPSVDQQYRLIAFIALFTQDCKKEIYINYKETKTIIDGIHENAKSIQSDERTDKEVFEKMMQIETALRNRQMWGVLIKDYCAVQQFVLKAQGYGKMFQSEQEGAN